MSAAAIAATGENFYETSQKAEDTRGSDDVSKEEFLRLLMEQLTNQDPLEPMNNQEFLGQLAQMQTLEEQRSMTTSISDMSAAMQENSAAISRLADSSGNESLLYALEVMRLESNLANASSMIGHTVTGKDGEDNTVHGSVRSVTVEGGVPYLNLESGGSLALVNVTAVDAPYDADAAA